jgi:hypothetical protein
VLCNACTARLSRLLAMAASIAGDLDDAVARLLKRGSSGGKRTADEQPLPYDARASDVAHELRNCLSGWVRVVQVGPDHPDYGSDWPWNTTGSMARWLGARMPRIRQHEAAADMLADVDAHVTAAVAVVDRRPGRLYGGPCPSCGEDLIGRPGASAMKCRCGQSVDVGERWGAMREVMRDMLGSAQWCVTASSALGAKVTDSAVYMWAQRKQLIPHGERPSLKGGKPVPLYRLGDVMKLAEEGPRAARIGVAKVPASAGTLPGRGQPD